MCIGTRNTQSPRPQRPPESAWRGAVSPARSGCERARSQLTVKSPARSWPTPSRTATSDARALRAAREDACLEVSHASAAAFMPLGA